MKDSTGSPVPCFSPRSFLGPCSRVHHTFSHGGGLWSLSNEKDSTNIFTWLPSPAPFDGLVSPYSERDLLICSFIPFMFSFLTTKVRKMKNPWI